MPSFAEFTLKRQQQAQQAQEANAQPPVQTFHGGRTRAAQNTGYIPGQPARVNQPAQGQVQASTMPAGGSSVNSSGRLTAGGAPPLWVTQQQQLPPAVQFDPNNFAKITTKTMPNYEDAKNYWQWAMGSQFGTKDFFGTLKPGDPVSGQPNRVWVQAPDGQWGWTDKPAANAEPTASEFAPPPVFQGEHTPTQFSQYGGPGPGNAQNELASQSLLAQLLQNPESLNPEVVAQMKEAQKDTNVSLADQLRQQTGNQFAARGLSGGGGQLGALNQIGEASMSDLLKSYRDIDIEAARTNTADRRAALDTANQSLTGATNRATSNYASRLAGQGAQEDANQFASTFGLDVGRQNLDAYRTLNDYIMDRYQTQYGGYQQNLDRLSQERIAEQLRALQRELGMRELDLGYDELALRERLGLDAAALARDQAILGFFR